MLTRVLHPLDAGPHIFVALLAVPLLFAFESNVPVLLLWAVHIVFLSAGLFEKKVLRQWAWRHSYGWWFAMQVTTLSAYTANTLCEFPTGVGEPHDTGVVVLLASAVWLALVCSLAIAVNWSLCVRAYRTWQNRHGRFTLAAQPPNDEARAPFVPTV